MIILIDGYNLLRALYPTKSTGLDKQRRELVELLSAYRAQRDLKVIVVFDGGLFSHATREIQAGVVVIFSGYKHTADDWILDFAKRKSGTELLLVSRDRALVDKARYYGADSVDVVDFYKLVKAATIAQNETPRLGNNVNKYEEDEGVGTLEHDYDLDALFEATNTNRYQKLDENEKQGRDSKSSKKSKEERRLEKKINKL